MLTERNNYEKLLKEKEDLLKKYAEIEKNNVCSCKLPILSELHAQTCEDKIDKKTLKDLAKILYDIIDINNKIQNQLLLVLMELGVQGNILQFK